VERSVVRLDVIPEEAGTLDRRGFCQLLGACVGGLVLGACTDDGSVVDVGPIGDGVDAAVSTDGSVVNPDASSGGACTGSPTDVGAPTAFTTGTATLFGMFFVMRDAGGLYAVSSQCTHRTGVTIGVSSGRFRCPRHGAIYNFDGSIVSGPVTRTLVHYAMCLLPNGHVGVSASQQVATSVRLVA
jgi:nitrite reductase/ring-hydroxylating ferredoxin subunit